MNQALNKARQQRHQIRTAHNRASADSGGWWQGSLNKQGCNALGATSQFISLCVSKLHDLPATYNYGELNMCNLRLLLLTSAYNSPPRPTVLSLDMRLFFLCGGRMERKLLVLPLSHLPFGVTIITYISITNHVDFLEVFIISFSL